MKRSYLTIAISVIVLISTGIWFYSDSINFKTGDLLQSIIILFLVGAGIFFGIRRLISEKRGEPAEDEMTKLIMMRAASISYFISIYLWLVIMYIADKGKYEIEMLFGWGILGMAVIFALSWVIHYIRATK